jgi:microcystin-dependent protein
MNTINFLEKKKLTYIIIFIFVVFALIHLYKINKQTNEAFATQNITDNVSVNSSSVYVDIPSLSQVRFDGSGLNTLLNAKANVSDLASKANLNTVTNLEAIINGTTGLNTKADKSALDNVKTTADTAFSTANNAMPELSIIAYAGGNNLPAGWQLCDGNVLFYTNGDSVSNLDKFVNLKKSLGMVLTPDLRGRFILGSNPEKVNGETTNFDRNIRLINETGGEEKHTLIEGEMPRHSHYVTTDTAGDGNLNHPDQKNSPYGFLPNSSIASSRSRSAWSYHLVGHTSPANAGVSSYKGEDLPHENMPPFYVLTYIIKQPKKL